MAIDFTRAVISIGLLAIARRLIGVVTCACALLTLLAAETRSQQLPVRCVVTPERDSDHDRRHGVRGSRELRW